MENDCARQQRGAATKEQPGEAVAEKRLQLLAREVMPALEEISPQPLQTATLIGKRCVQTIGNKEEGMSTTNEQVVVEFFRAFDRLDLEGALSYLTEDCIHDDKPVGIHRGKEEIRQFFAPQMKELKSFRAELKETLSVGNMVVNERVDWIELQGGKKAALPVMGAFEIQAGKIAVWRDYYDMASFHKQISGR
jgi:limonene-1,2-epoxide hydrolase